MSTRVILVDTNWRSDTLANEEFVRPIKSIVERAGYHPETLHFKEKGNFDDSRAVIICGNALMDNYFLEDMKKFEWIRHCKSMILGICAGMQVIGSIYGCNVRKQLNIGMVDVQETVKNPIISNTQAYTMHSNSIVPNEEFIVLAKSKYCAEAIKHREKDIYGILFHPEVRNERVVERFLHLASYGENEFSR